MNQFELVISIIITVLLAVLVSVVLLENLQIDRLQANIKTYQDQISYLQQESEQQQEDYEAARKEANKQMQQIEDKSKAILNAKVSKNCDKAIKWGIDEAHNYT